MTPPPTNYGEPWKAETGDFEIYSTAQHDAVAYAESPQIRDRIITAMNALAGIADPSATIQSLRDAVKDADVSLRLCLNHILSIETSAPGEVEALESAHQTLSKIQPLLKI